MIYAFMPISVSVNKIMQVKQENLHAWIQNKLLLIMYA